MILVDANIAIYAYDASSARHDAARVWFERVLASESDVRFGLISLLAFVRLTTNPRVMTRPLATSDAMAIVDSWIDRANVAICETSARHWKLMSEVATTGGARGALLMDAHLAALAIEHGATLMTTDRGFARFAELRWADPLA